jgi:hypothetical protein
LFVKLCFIHVIITEKKRNENKMPFKCDTCVILVDELPVNAWPKHNYYNKSDEKNPNIPKKGDIGKIVKVNGGGWLSIRFENSDKSIKIRNGNHLKKSFFHLDGAWFITVPPKVKPGDRFVVLLGNQTVGLVCPNNVGPEFEKKKMIVLFKEIRQQALSMESGSMDVWQWVAQ